MEAVRTVILLQNGANLVIFVDEIENVRNFDFADEFFAGIRACSNGRTEDAVMKN